jgi:hypothetical protein
MELYKTFGFALTPFVVLGLIGFQYYVLTQSFDFQINQISNSQLIGFVVIVFFAIICMGLALEWWVHYFYGKYAREIRKVIDELKEEE